MHTVTYHLFLFLFPVFLFLLDSAKAPSDRHLTSVTSTRSPSSPASRQPTSTTPLEKQTSTFSSVTVPYYEADWAPTDLSAIPINQTAIQLTWKVRVVFLCPGNASATGN